MNEYYSSPPGRGRFLGWFHVLAAALLGSLLTLGALPFMLPYIIPEPSPADFYLPYIPDNIPLGQLQEHQQTAVVEAISRVSPAVVGVTNLARDLRGTGMIRAGVGSGVIFRSDGYIVTNYHVVQRAAQVVITLFDGQEMEAEILGIDPGTDLAVLRIPIQGLPAAQFGDSDRLVPGEYAIAIGNPGGLQLERSVSLGVISATGRSIEVYDWVFGLIQTDAAINPGNSGGPLLNARGQVIGINSVKLLNAEGLGFAIPSNLVRAVSESLVQYGRVIRPMLGVSIVELNEMTARRFQVTQTAGLYISDTLPGGPARQAGIQSGDIIVKVAEQQTHSLRELRQVLSRKQVGETVRVEVIRAGRSRTIDVVLADMASQ